MIPIKMLQRGLRINAQGVALVDGKLSITYMELARHVDAFADYLQKTLPVPQARIGLCAHNNWQHVVAMLGIFASGHTWVPLNPAIRARSLRALRSRPNCRSS